MFYRCDPNTGEISGFAASSGQIAQWEAAGFVAVESPIQIAADDLADYRLEGEDIVYDPAAALARARTARLIELQRGLDQTLARKADGTDRYPPNWLAGAREVVAAYDEVAADPAKLAAMAAALGLDEAGLTAAMAQCRATAKAVLDWQLNKVSAYFYSVKAQLEAASDLAALEAVAWDWAQFHTEAEGGAPATADPDVSLDGDVSLATQVGGASVSFMSVYVTL